MTTQNINTHYDAIVIGSGMSGGWAAKELSERGLKVLVLERGRDVKHGEYPTAFTEKWDLESRGILTPEDKKRQFQQMKSHVSAENKHWFVDDIQHPYTEKKPFSWLRGYHVGGRSLTWGRHSYRFSDLDFTANIKEGVGVDWPIRYQDIAPWYDYVEKFVGISGQNEGLPQLPDGQFLPAMPLNCVEQVFKKAMFEQYGRVVTSGRIANLTQAHQGRGPCQYRARCDRGCPFGGYFSSNSATLPAAYATNKVTMRAMSIVQKIIYDDNQQKATGVLIKDAISHQEIEFTAPIIFCCASAVASTAILMNSTSARFPNGLGNDSGELGHNLMDHHHMVGASGEIDEHQDDYYKGRRPSGFYIPRFRNVDNKSKRNDYTRGFGYQGRASRQNWTRGIAELDLYGADFKNDLISAGPWKMGMTGFGECLPYHENKMVLSKTHKDEWGLPLVEFDAEFKQNELTMRQDMMNSAAEMLESAGYKNIKTFNKKVAPGYAVHEMGTARMGHDPKTSVLNKWNQIHSVKNVFVTDGACMTSASCVNPSLTYMALTARAAAFAVDALKKGDL